MSYKVGYVYHVNSFSEVYPAKGKFGICVCIAKGFFFMINTDNRAIYDCIPILASQHSKLGQDRFVSCKSPLTVPEGAQITESYKISAEFLKELIAKVETSKFLSSQQKLEILAELNTII